MKRRDSDTLAVELGHLCRVASEATGRKMEFPSDLRIASEEELAGGRETMLKFHVSRMLDICEASNPDDIDVSATPSGLSVVEYKFMDDFFNNLGMKQDWLFQKAARFISLKYPEERQKSPHLQELYSGFGYFLESLSPEARMLMLAPSQQEAFIDSVYDNDDAKIAAYDAVENMRDHNWAIINNLGPLWLVNFPEQFEEAERYCPSIWNAKHGENSGAIQPKPYSRKLQKTDELMKFVKAVVHEMAKTVVPDPENPDLEIAIDATEKESLSKLLDQRCEGFDTLDERCVDRMLVDITRKDLLAHLAITGRLAGVSVPKKFEYEGRLINLGKEIYDVGEKADSMQKMLKVFEGKPMDRESMNLVLYAAHNIFGIRGSNCELLLEPCEIDEGMIKKAGLHDMPEMHKMNEELDYFRKSNVPGIKELVRLNKGGQYF